MIRPIVKDTFFLSRKSTEATQEDLQIVQDMIDTLLAHKDRCVGLAANMIGQAKQILVYLDGETPYSMLNPQIIRKKGKYVCEEGCLSLEGVRKVERYRRIVVSYQNTQMKTHVKQYTGYVAQIIQHEIDHFSGILI